MLARSCPQSGLEGLPFPLIKYAEWHTEPEQNNGTWMTPGLLSTSISKGYLYIGIRARKMHTVWPALPLSVTYRRS